MPIVPSLKLAHLSFRFFAVPAVMLLKLGGQNFDTPILELTELLFGQTAPSLLDTIFDLNEIVLPLLHVTYLRCTITLLHAESRWSFKEVNVSPQLVFNTSR